MANELATAYIQLLPSFRGLKQEISRGLQEATPAARAAGAKAGDTFTESFGDQSAAGKPAADFSREWGQQGARSGEAFSDSASSALGDIPTSFGDVLGGLPAIAAGVGAAAGAVVVKAVSDALERGQLESSFKAALDVGDNVAADLGQRAGEIYAANYGESIAEVGDAVTLVQRRFGDELSGDELTDITSKALTLSNVFDEDLNSIIRASGKLLSTGLASDAQEAFDILTVGLQGSANEGQDFLDTINEYSTQFRKLGIDGTDALNLIQQGIGAGARDSDVLADALKEFSIRAVDGSAAVAQAFGALGIEDGANRIAQGGAVARQALDETLDALREVDDPALRAQIAFNLFGTQSEDLGAALLALDLDTVTDELNRIPGAADRANDSFDDLGSNIEELKRSFGIAGSDVINQLLAAPAAALSDKSSLSDIGRGAAETFWAGFQAFVPQGGIIGGLVNGIAGLFKGDDENQAKNLDESGNAAAGATDELNEYEKAAKNVGVSAQVAADGANAISAALDRNRISANLAAVGLQAASAAADAYLQSVENATSADDLLEAGLQSGNALRSILEGSGAAQSESNRRSTARAAAVETDRLATEQLRATQSASGLAEAVRDLDPAMSELVISQNAAAKASAAFKDSLERSTGIDNLISGAVSLGDAYRDFRRSARGLPAELDLVGVSLGNLRPRQQRAVQALLQLGSASRDYLATLLEQPGGQARTREEAARLRDEYSAQFRQLGLNESQITNYLQALGLTPEQVDTAIKVSGLEESRSKLESYLSLLEGKIPGGVASSVITAIDAGDIEGAANQLANFAKTNPIDIPLTVTADTPSITAAQDALDELDQQALSLPSTYDAVTAALGGYTDAQSKGLQAVLEFGDKAQGVIAGFIKSGDIAGAENAAGRLRDAFRNEVLPALGVTDEKAKDVYESLIGLDGTTVETSIKTAGAEEALTKLGLYSEILQKLGSFTLEEQFQIADLIDQGDIEGAKRLIDAEVEQGRQLTLDLALDPSTANGQLNDFRGGTEASPPIKQPLGLNKQPADNELGDYRLNISTGLPFLPKLSFNVGPALEVLASFRKSVDEADDFVVGLVFDGVKFFKDLAGDLGVDIDIAKMIFDEFIDLLPGFASGGLIGGPGGPQSDSILARVSNGEYVMDAATVSAYGVDFFEALQKNKKLIPGFAAGGLVGVVQAPDPMFAGMGGATINYSVTEAKSRPTPEDLLRVTRSAIFLGSAR